MNLFGRKVLYTDAEQITKENIVKVLGDVMTDHLANQGQIEYLFNYYKGKQPILDRVKEVRPEINHRIVENHANEIVSFKVGYLMGEPVQYVSRVSENADEIAKLNAFMFADDKASKDRELSEWSHICGTSYRMTLPKSVDLDETEAPFEIFTLDPRTSFVVYHNGLGNKPLMGVTYVERENGDKVYSCYTDAELFTIENDEVIDVIPHALGTLPIIEYPANAERMGVFEVVISLLDAINEVASDRANAIDQFVQALMVLKGVDIDEESFKALKELGGIKVPVDGDVEFLTQELSQNSTQTLVDNMYETVLTIVGMPSRSSNKSGSTSDTGAGVILRNGWYLAESRAKNSELIFKRSEKKFLKLAMSIANTIRRMNLSIADVEIRFTRRNYENIQEKAQVLTLMLSNEQIHPRLAFEHSGLFIDPELAYKESMEHLEEQERKSSEQLEQFRIGQVTDAKADLEEEVDE